MPQGQSKIFTQTVTNANFTLTAAMGIFDISIMATSGTVTLSGDGIISGSPSNAITLPLNMPVNLQTRSNQALVGITVNATSGTVVIVAMS